MRSSSLAARAWPIVLIAALLLVAADFVRHPFDGVPQGVAAAPPRELTLWVPGTDAGTAPEAVARAAAHAMNRRHDPVTAADLRGGSATAIDALFDTQRGFGGGLLVVNAGTLSDLARDRTDETLPGAAREAARAQRLLAESRPVAILADDTLVLVSDRRSGIRSAAQVLGALHADPGRYTFGVGSDAWSKTALAALVESVHAPGRVRYDVEPTAADAAIATSGTEPNVVLAPRAELRSEAVAGQLRVLAQSDVGPQLHEPDGTPVPRLGDLLGEDSPVARAHRWIALFAPPTTSAAEVRRLAARVKKMAATPGWRRALKRLALTPPADIPASRYLAEARETESTLETTAQRVPQAGRSR